jgi:succinoglycan biosynthesis transport protein ExoP
MLPVRPDRQPLFELVESDAPRPADALEPNLRGVVAALRRHRLLLLSSILLAIGLGVAYTLYARPVYEATSVVRFEVERLDLPQLVQLQHTENLISTELEVLGGRSAALAVVDSLGLRAHLLAPRRGRRTELFAVLRVMPTADSGTLVFHAQGDAGFTVTRPDSARVLGSVRFGDTATVAGVLLALTPAARGLPDLRLRIDLPDDAIKSFQSGLKVSRPARDADLLAIRTRAGDPVEAAAMANLLAQNVIAGRQAFSRERTSGAAAFLQEQADTLRRQLRAAEDSLRAYQEREHVVDAPEQARSQVARLAGLQADLAVIRADRDAFARLIEQLRSDSTGQSLGGQAPSRRFMAFPSLLRNESASVLLGALAQVETQRADLLIRRTPADSDVQVLTGRIREIEGQLQGIAESYLQSLTNQVTSLEGEAGRFGVQLDALPAKELQSARRERDARVLNDLWVLVQTRLKEAEITGSVGDPTVRLVDAAAPPLRPARPSLPINLALALVLGALVGVTLSLARELGDRSVRSRADALAAAGLPVLGAIPRVSRPGLTLPWRRRQLHAGIPGALSGEPSGADSAIGPKRGRAAAGIASLLVTRPGIPAAYLESFNQLFANLALVYRQRPVKVVVFTSPLPGEGKTLSAINFALIGASRGLRMLLIDADLRCGLVGAVLGCGRKPGFAELLAGTAQAGDVLRQVWEDHGSLVAVPSGALPKVPGRVLTIERVQEVLGALAPQFDFVVIDTPPVNLLADAALLGSAADGVVLVVRAGHTQTEALRFAMEQLEATWAPVLGVLLNDIDLRRNVGDDGAYRYLVEVERYYVGAG